MAAIKAWRFSNTVLLHESYAMFHLGGLLKLFALFFLLALFTAIGYSQSRPPAMQVTRPAPNTWLVCHGDSITFGAGLLSPATQTYPALVWQAAITAHPTLAFGLWAFGINGQGFSYVYPPSSDFPNLTVDAVNRVDPVLPMSGTHYLVIFAGTNDIFLNNKTGTEAGALNLTYIDARIAAGWPAANICVGTMLPRQNAHEADRTTYNGLIRSNAVLRGYKVCDFAANSTIGDAGDENNTTYYSDTIHPTAAGQVIIAGVISAALFP